MSTIYKTPEGEEEILKIYDSVLNTWPVPYETKIIPTSKGDTFSIICGDEKLPNLILLHGAASNATSWIGDIAEYSNHFRVYVIDVPGHPGKSAQNWLSFQNKDYSEWLNDVLICLKIEKTNLLGLSQGGWIALRFATSFPEKIVKLVLLTPAGITPTKGSFILKAIFFSLFGKAGARKINKIVFSKQEIDAKALEYMDIIMSNYKARFEKEYIFTDSELTRLDMPVLLVGGTDDAIRSIESIINRLTKYAKKLKTIILPGMGHVLVNISDKIIPFLKKENV